MITLLTLHNLNKVVELTAGETVGSLQGGFVNMEQTKPDGGFVIRDTRQQGGSVTNNIRL